MFNRMQRDLLRAAPSPLAGEGWGGGLAAYSELGEAPSLTLPRKGGGNMPSSPSARSLPLGAA